MRYRRAVLASGMLSAALTAATLLSACAASAKREVPAVIVRPTPASRAELGRAVQRALHSDPVLLSPDALTNTNVLSIDRIVRRDAQGRPIDGLNIRGRPEVFELVRVNNGCVLVYAGRDSLRQALRDTMCAPIPRKQQ